MTTFLSNSKASRLTNPIRLLPPANASSTLPNPPPPAFHRTGKMSQAGDQCTLSRAQGAGGLLSSAPGEPLGWLPRRRKRLPASPARCASPSFLQMEAGEKEPALRPRAPLFSEQTHGKWSHGKPRASGKREWRLTGRCNCFQNIVKF